MRIVRTRRGAVVLERHAVLSTVLSAPGPLHDLYDVLAAAVVELSPGPRVVLLGFAGGGILAPLRALGWSGKLRAVDRSLELHGLYRELAEGWAGEVQVHRAEASEWLARRDGSLDAVIEDLTVCSTSGPTKPPVSVDVLPGLMRRRVARGGIVAVNVLPVPGMAWKTLLPRIAAPWPDARVVTFREYENRVLICGSGLPAAAALSLRLRARLRAIGSRQLRRIAVRTLPRGGSRAPVAARRRSGL